MAENAKLLAVGDRTAGTGGGLEGMLKEAAFMLKVKEAAFGLSCGVPLLAAGAAAITRWDLGRLAVLLLAH